MKTTLADIAEAAEMSASHLLYYFNGKDDILEQYFESVSVQYLDQIEKLSQYPPKDQIRRLADLWFESAPDTKREIGFMLECFGVAVHDDVLRQIKADFDSRCKAHLLRIFESGEGLPLGTAKESTEAAYSMMIGLRSALYFDEDVSLAQAHALFMKAMEKMAGTL